jgi:hypothetical protein
MRTVLRGKYSHLHRCAVQWRVQMRHDGGVLVNRYVTEKVTVVMEMISIMVSGR